MKKLKAIIFFLIAFTGAYGQPAETTDPLAQDSLRQDSIQQHINSQIQLRTNQLLELRRQQAIDSMKRVQLEDRLGSYQLLDNKEKASLKKQLDDIKRRDSLSLIKQKQKVDSLKAFRKGVAVVPFRDSIFAVYLGSGSFTIKERAEAIGQRIHNLANNYLFNPDSLRVFQEDDMFYIGWNDINLMGIGDKDALWMNTGAQQLAESYKTSIIEAIGQYRYETGWKTTLKNILLVLLVITIAGVMIFAVNKCIVFVRNKLEAKKDTLFNGLKIKGYELVNGDKELSAVQKIVTIAKWITIVIVIYLALPALFNIFPQTNGYADTLIGYFLTPLKNMVISFVDYLPNLITIIVIVTIFMYLLRLLHFFSKELKRGALRIPGFYPDWAIPTYQLLRVVVLAFMMVIVFQYLPNNDSKIFQGVSVFMGVLFTFGSAGALGNIVAGMVLTYMRAFRIGDRVKIGEVMGDIIEKSLLVTRVRTPKNEIISIPNSTVMNSHTINYSSDAPEKGLIIHTTITMGYEIPWPKIHELSIQAALNVELIEKDPKPFVLQTTLNDFYVSYQINAYTKHPNKQAQIYSDLHKELLDVFHDAGIEMLSPYYSTIRDGNMTTIPPESIPKDYKMPSFSVDVKNND